MDNLSYISMLFSAFITITAYFFIPVILILWGRKFSLTTIKVVSVANALLIYIIFSIIHFLQGNGTIANFTACCLWGILAYSLLKNKLLIHKSSSAIENSSNGTTNRVIDPLISSQENKKKPSLNIVFSIIAVLFFLILTFTGGYYIGVNDNAPAIFSSAHEEGYSSGYEKGYDKGYELGYADGEEKGMANVSTTYGYRTGYEDGHKAAMKENYFKNYPITN